MDRIRLLLADDDKDDRDLFKDALEELDLSAEVSTVHDGEQLMQFLRDAATLPQVIFLDLNMPRKNGFECLSEIRTSEKFRDIPIVIFSTSFDRDIARSLYDNGARHYMQKPNSFEKLKEVIQSAISSVAGTEEQVAGMEQFVL